MDWQPIETAPLTGARLLIFVPPYGVSCGHYDTILGGGDGRWVLHSVLNKAAIPTHWMPLPSPPEAPDMTRPGDVIHET
jgi:hypothetical protein